MTKALYTISGTNVPQNLTTTFTPFNHIVIYPIKSFTISGYPTYNTNTVYLGVESGKLPIALATGSSYSLTVPSIHEESLQNWWIEGQVNDGVYVIAY